MKQTGIKTILSLFLAFSAAISCGGKDEPETEGAAAPVLQETSPADGAKDVAYSQALKVVLSYDQNIKCPMSERDGITIKPEASISSIGASGKDLTITIDGLEGSTSYTLTVPEGAVQGFKANQKGAAKASLSFTTAAPVQTEPEVDPDVLPERGTSTAWKMAEKLGLGFNLGNQMDAYVNDVANETCWGNGKCTQATFTKLKSYGFKTVRIPITWMGHIGAAPEYKIEEAWMNRVAEIVGYAESAGLNCIINTHHDEHNKDSEAHWLDIQAASSSAAKNTQIKEELAAVWTQIAEKFKTKGDWLIFEPFNEIQDGGWGWSNDFLKNPQAQYNVLNEWNQTFVDAVRATGGNNASRWLCAIGYACSPSLTMKGLVLPKDTAEGRIMVGIHCYDPSSFCGAGTNGGSFEEWGHGGAAGKKPSDDERSLRKTMSQLYETYVKNGIPCYFGEFGCVNKKTERGSLFQKYYLEYFCKAARCYGLPCILWDNGSTNTSSGEAFGYVDHATGDYIGHGASVIPVMAKGQNDTSASYTLESVYNNSPK